MKQLARVFNRKPLYYKKSAVDWPLPDQLVGLEVEAENIRGIQEWPDESSFRMYWKRVNDGSLQRGFEYVLTQPMAGDTLGGAIQCLFTTGKLMRDPAGSTHIHLNMMNEDDTVDGLRNLCIFMYLFEELLFTVGDPGRAACGFTNRLITAPERFLRTILSPKLDENPQLLSNVFCGEEGNTRYYGFNMQSLSKHGTVEFRYFPTATNAEELINWIKLLMSFKKAAVEISNVQSIELMLSSENSYAAFVNENFGTWYEVFLSTIPYAKAKRTMDTIRAMSNGISHPQVTTVNVDKLRDSTRFKKFFASNKKQPDPIPVIRPDVIHYLPETSMTLPERTGDSFDRSLKHIMIYDTGLYVWASGVGWDNLDGYGIYNRLVSGHTHRHVEMDDYVTWDHTLIALMREAVNAKRAEITGHKYTRVMSVIDAFAEWVGSIVHYYESGAGRRQPSDGVYRVKHTKLSALWDGPVSGEGIEARLGRPGGIRPGSHGELYPEPYDEDEDDDVEEDDFDVERSEDDEPDEDEANDDTFSLLGGGIPPLREITPGPVRIAARPPTTTYWNLEDAQVGFSPDPIPSAPDDEVSF